MTTTDLYLNIAFAGLLGAVAAAVADQALQAGIVAFLCTCALTKLPGQARPEEDRSPARSKFGFPRRLVGMHWRTF